MLEGLEFHTEIAVAWLVGGSVCIALIIMLYALMKPMKMKVDKTAGCRICTDGSCLACRERVVKSLKRRDLLTHKKDCHYRETLGAGQCDCGAYRQED